MDPLQVLNPVAALLNHEELPNHTRLLPSHSYCPPKYEQFDIRSFEENMPTVIQKMPPFRHAFMQLR